MNSCIGRGMYVYKQHRNDFSARDLLVIIPFLVFLTFLTWFLWVLGSADSTPVTAQLHSERQTGIFKWASRSGTGELAAPEAAVDGQEG